VARGVPTIRTVAEEAGVSVATVSYVLSGRTGGSSRVSIPTQRRVVEAAERLGYQPNQQARGVRRGRTDQVCLALDRLDTAWSQRLVDEVSQAVSEDGLTVLVLVDGDWKRFLLGKGADGALIDGIRDAERARPALRALADRGIALVVHTNVLEPDGFDVVRSDEATGLREAMALLLSRHRRIACLRSEPADPLARTAARERYAVYVDALREAGLEVDDDLVRDAEGSRDRAYAESVDLLDRAHPPTAILALDDEAAICAVHAARRLDIAIPEQLEVIGVGNTPEARSAEPPVTSVGPERFFAEAAGLLRRRLQEPSTPGTLSYVPWQLNLGGTTRG
jgi:LacI family transcriptional regulator